jgi:hypothetical protein
MDRRRFLRTSCGMAVAFVALNDVFGPLFDVSPAEAAQPEAAAERANGLAGQFILDDQVHFVRDDYKVEDILAGEPKATENPIRTNIPKPDGPWANPSRAGSCAAASTVQRQVRGSSSRGHQSNVPLNLGRH